MPKGVELTMSLVTGDFGCHFFRSYSWHCALGQKNDGGNMTCVVGSYNPPARASKVIEGHPGRLSTRSGMARRAHRPAHRRAWVDELAESPDRESRLYRRPGQWDAG